MSYNTTMCKTKRVRNHSPCRTWIISALKPPWANAVLPPNGVPWSIGSVIDPRHLRAPQKLPAFLNYFPSIWLTYFSPHYEDDFQPRNNPFHNYHWGSHRQGGSCRHPGRPLLGVQGTSRLVECLGRVGILQRQWDWDRGQGPFQVCSQHLSASWNSSCKSRYPSAASEGMVKKRGRVFHLQRLNQWWSR